MKKLLTPLLVLSLSSLAFADEASHRAAAGKMLELSDTKGAMRGGFLLMIEPMISGMTQRGMPATAGEEMRTAMAQWFDEEMKWEEIKPQIVDLYVKEFSEKELGELIAFHETPTGKKALTRTPIIMKEGGAIGQKYATAKQESLNRKIQPIVEKYRPKPTP